MPFALENLQAYQKIVTAAWVGGRLAQADSNTAVDPIIVIDPRRPMKYLSGHLPGAINVPVYKTFGVDGRLLPPDALAGFIGEAGIGDDSTPVIYDSPEGQNAAMLAWILEYIGHRGTAVMDTFFEGWKAAGREVLYKPVTAASRRFRARVNSAVRVTLDELRAEDGVRLVDFRSREEFTGERVIAGDAAGHIAGAVNLVWRELNDAPAGLLASRENLRAKCIEAGIAAGDKIVAYCRSGPRAALGYLALRELGYDVRLFDGSFAEWSRAGLPAEK
jgi:thiosulfate/3-mercaptopyruvate sulfurtransferase